MEKDELVDIDTIFDGFEFVDSGEKASKEEQTKEGEEEENKEEETEGGDKDENEDTTGEDGEEEGGQTDEDKEAGKPEEEVLDDEELEALRKEIKAEAPIAKTIKAKKGTEEIELEETLVIPTKVEGKFEEVTLADLRASYSSKEHNHRQFRKLEQERRGFVEAREQFDSVIQSFAQKTKAGEVVPAVMELIAATGEDPMPIINNIREGLIESAGALFEMTKEQRLSLYKQEAADYYYKQTARLREQQQAQEKQQVLEQAINQAISVYSIPDREAFLDTVPKAEMYLREAKAKGQVDKNIALTPEMVAKYYQAEKLRETFRGVMAEVAPTIREGSSEWDKFAQWVATNKPPREKIAAAAKKLFSSNGSAKAKATQGKTEKPSKPEKKAKRLEELASIDPGLDIDATPDLSNFNWQDS
jgi:hypothetical protein